MAILCPALAAAQTYRVTWKTPATWNIDLIAGRTFSQISGDHVRHGPREFAWVAGATFGRYDGRRVGFNVQVLYGKQRTAELLFAPPRPATYTLDFVEVPLLLRFDPFHQKNSGGLLSIFGGVGIGRRFHLERTFDGHTTTARWAMYTDAIVGASVDLRRAIVSVEYFNGLTKFAPATGTTHLRSLVVTAGYQVKRGPMGHGAEGGWEVELHAGGLLASRASGGTGIAPPEAGAFPTATPPISTRRISSWFMADGAQLFNQATSTLPSASQIVSLDPVYTGVSAQRQSGAIFGVRLSHPVASRISAELSLDLSQTPVGLDREALDRIETSRASFAAAFTNFVAAFGFTGTNVTATSDIHNNTGRQILATAGVNVRLTRERKITPYARAGLGVELNKNGTNATVRGVYDFRTLSAAPFHESDTISMKFSSGASLLGQVGGGVTYVLSERTGLRFDAGMSVSRNRLRTTLTTAPAKTSANAPFALIIFPTSSPAVQFSNFSTLTQPSSLSGVPMQEFETFRGRGLQVQTGLTVGIYRRF